MGRPGVGALEPLKGGAGGALLFWGGGQERRLPVGAENSWAFGKGVPKNGGYCLAIKRTTSPQKNRKWLPREVFTLSLQVKKRKGSTAGGLGGGAGPAAGFPDSGGGVQDPPQRDGHVSGGSCPPGGSEEKSGGSVFLRGTGAHGAGDGGGGGWVGGVCASESPAGSPPSLRGPGLAYKSGLLAGVTGCGLTVSRVGGQGGAGLSWTEREQL